MHFLLYAPAFLAGLMNPLQTACTGELNRVLGRPFMVGVISVCGTAAVTLIGSLLLGQFGFGGKGGQVPWWAWFGGLAGAVFLLSQPVAAQKIGAEAFIGLLVTAALIASVVLDNYSWLGFQQHAASLWRIASTVLMIVGVVLPRIGVLTRIIGFSRRSGNAALPHRRRPMPGLCVLCHDVLVRVFHHAVAGAKAGGDDRLAALGRPHAFGYCRRDRRA